MDVTLLVDVIIGSVTTIITSVCAAKVAIERARLHHKNVELVTRTKEAAGQDFDLADALEQIRVSDTRRRRLTRARHSVEG
jgi:hypothetical protein